MSVDDELHKLRQRGATGEQVRHLVRRGAYGGFTHGLAPGYVQGNLAVLPASLAPTSCGSASSTRSRAP